MKSLAKRKPVIADMPFMITEDIITSNALIEYFVRKIVNDYNNGASSHISPVSFLTEEKIADGAKRGKIDFGERKNKNIQNIDAAVENALTCFFDGMFRLFINDEAVEINQPIRLKEGDEITFVRLTMLAGCLW